MATPSRASVIWNGPILKFFGLFFTCATLTVCVYRVEFLSRQTSISRWLILRGIFWKKQMHRSYLIFSQSEDHLIVIPLVDCDSPFGDHSIRKKYGLLPLWNLNIFFFHFVGRKIWSEQRINIRCFHKTIKTKKVMVKRRLVVARLSKGCSDDVWVGQQSADCEPVVSRLTVDQIYLLCSFFQGILCQQFKKTTTDIIKKSELRLTEQNWSSDNSPPSA